MNLKKQVIDFTSLYKLTERVIAKPEMCEKYTSSGFVFPQIQFKKMVLSLNGLIQLLFIAKRLRRLIVERGWDEIFKAIRQISVNR